MCSKRVGIKKMVDSCGGDEPFPLLLEIVQWCFEGGILTFGLPVKVVELQPVEL